jgi:glutathione-regulated potassium-efflux system protein KefB
VMQMLDERGITSTPEGQQAVSILLLEDLAIVPLLAIVAFLGPMVAHSDQPRWLSIAIGVGAIVALIAAGRWLLNPMFGILANSKAREVMTAAALLVVLGSALLMELGGLSMAMGAFLAGVLLSESSFRHQLEADIEPFRGILLGLFFMAVGMSLDLSVVVEDAFVLVAAVIGFVIVKAIGIYGVARAFKAGNREALTRVAMFSQGGEFAFVLYAAATAVGIFDPRTNALFTAAVILSMAITPITVLILDRLMPAEEPSFDGIEKARDLKGNVLLIGFGRFGQVVSQPLLARGYNVSTIETDVELIRVAATFGFKVHYGDGTRLDILHAAGAGAAEAILVCVDKREATDRIVELVKAEFPMTKLFVRSYDRGHTLDLIHAGVDYQMRETFESAMSFGTAVLRGLGVPQEDAADIAEDVRRRDAERLELQLAGGLTAGRALIRGNAPVPAPLTEPRRKGQIVGVESEGAVGSPSGPG